MSEVAVSIREWETASPDDDEFRQLAGFAFADGSARTLAADLTDSGRVKILELARGLQIHARSFVGRVKIGRLELTIRPKIPNIPLLNLLRYAYRLRDLERYPEVGYSLGQPTFVDILIHQLATEVQELMARGLHRTYIRRDQDLASPRGRIDFGSYAYARRVRAATASLPCTHYPRLHDNPLNQALLAGLRLATAMTEDLTLRSRLRRLAEQLRLKREPTSLNFHLLDLADKTIDRRTIAYRPAITLMSLLLAGESISLELGQRAMRLPGFLFDMNRFFQVLLSRFLQEYLQGYTVQDEVGLRGMMAYIPGYDRPERRPPTPRPDYVVKKGQEVAVILDAKYRDLWTHGLPRDMLYQLAIYALSQEAGAQATILYPTSVSGARELRIEIQEPVYGDSRAQVVQRPVDLMELEQLVTSNSFQAGNASRAYARYLVFGKETNGEQRTRLKRASTKG